MSTALTAREFELGVEKTFMEQAIIAYGKSKVKTKKYDKLMVEYKKDIERLRIEIIKEQIGMELIAEKEERKKLREKEKIKKERDEIRKEILLETKKRRKK